MTQIDWTRCEQREIALVLCCSRTHMDTSGQELLQSLVQSGIDWPKVAALAVGHGIVPLVLQNLATHCAASVPSLQREQLKLHRLAIASWNLYLTQALLRVLTILNSEGIRALPFKGPTLAAAIYGNLAGRQSSDLDILVDEHSVDRVYRLLCIHGYSCELTSAQQKAARRRHYHYAFQCGEGTARVEIHWALSRRYWRFGVAYDDLWARRISVIVAGTPVETLAYEDLLLALCIHGTKECWCVLKWISDVAELLSIHPNMKWDELLAEARTARAVRVLFLGVTLAHDLFGAALPDEIFDKSRGDAVVQRVALQIQSQIRCGDTTWSRGIDPHTYYIEMRERLQDRVRYCLFGYLIEACSPTAAPPSCVAALLQLSRPTIYDDAWGRLPRHLRVFYRAVRLVRLIVQHGQRLCGLVAKDVIGTLST
jgi:hypothetical protein